MYIHVLFGSQATFIYMYNVNLYLWELVSVSCCVGHCSADFCFDLEDSISGGHTVTANTAGCGEQWQTR